MGTTLDISFPPNTTPANPTGYACGDSGNVWEITDTITNRNSLSASTFRGISAPSVNNVWVCGGGSVFYYSENSFTGQIVPSGTFNDIHFINENEGWLVGTAGIIVHTTDGGSTWNEQINPDPQKKTLIKVIFLDADNGWAVGAYGIILHTTDGGSNWVVMESNVSSLPLTGVHFTSPTNGYIVGNYGTLLKYTEEN
jgi:hypothetical protein